MLRWFADPGLWTLCCSLSPTFRTSIMHPHIWGKSDVICYWCILEFKSSLIQTKGWIEGSEERQKETDSSLCQYFTPAPLSQRSHERQKSTYPKFDLNDTPHNARTRRFITIFTKACHWNHHAPDEFSPKYNFESHFNIRVNYQLDANICLF